MIHTPTKQHLLQDQSWVESGRLHASTSSFLETSSLPDKKGVLLCLHGWSASPWQYRPLAQVLKAQGWDVLALRLPGHGFRFEGKEDSRFLLRTFEHGLYASEALRMAEMAHGYATSQGVPLAVMGFSGGGAMAVSMLAQRPSYFSKAILVAPFFGPYEKKHQKLFEVLLWAHRFLHMGWFFDRIPHAWEEDPREVNTGWKRMGHRCFRIGNLLSLYAFAKSLREVVLNMPVHMVLSDGDETIDRAKAWAFYQQQKHASLTHFEAAQKVPHAMLTPYENPMQQAREKLFDDVAHFLTT
jgi:alpha-beta hydrolase superfamily lysophospholipase